MFHDTHIHLEMLLDNLKMSNFRGEMEFLENSLWQKSLENNSLSNQNQTNLCQYFDKINQIKITKEQKSKIVELFQNHEFAIHSTVNFANFGLVYQLFSDFPKIKFLFGSHPEIVNTDFDLEKYLENQQNFLNFWTQNQNQNELNLGKIGSQNNSVNSLNLEKNLENTQHNSLILDSNWSQKIIGIGEIGLDYFYTKDQNLIKIQQKLLESQIELSLNWQSKLTNLGKDLELNQETEKINSQNLKLKKLAIRNLEIQEKDWDKNFGSLPQPDLQNNSQTLPKKLENNSNLPKNFPIVIHCREAFADLISILKNFPAVHNNFLVHCWTGNSGELRQILDLGGIVAFGGILTYKSAEDLRIAARFCPLDRLTLETDLPFLSPQNNRGKVCLPDFIDETCEKLAQIKNVEKSVIWQKSLKNTRKLFQFQSV